MPNMIKKNTIYPGSPAMVELEVEVIIKTRMASLTQRAIHKLERAGVRVVSVERSANRATIHGTLRVKAKELPHEINSVRSDDASQRRRNTDCRV